MSYTIWLKVESDDPPEFEGEAWWSIDTQPTRERALETAEEIATKLRDFFGMDVTRLED